METGMQEKKDYSKLVNKISNVVGIVLCIIFVPILVINCTLLIKGWANKEEVPTIGSYAPMIVMTGSMSGSAKDNFDGGDLIIIRTAEPEDVKVGDVITFYDPDGNGTSVLSHRVIEIFEEGGKTYFRTKGDANPTADTTPAPAESLIGKYTGFKVPNAGHVAMFMQSTWGLIICVVLPIILLVGFDMLRRYKYEKKHVNDKDQLLAELEELRRLKAEKESGSAEQPAAESTEPEDTLPPKDGEAREGRQ